MAAAVKRMYSSLYQPQGKLCFLQRHCWRPCLSRTGGGGMLAAGSPPAGGGGSICILNSVSPEISYTEKILQRLLGLQKKAQLQGIVADYTPSKSSQVFYLLLKIRVGGRTFTLFIASSSQS